MTYLDALKIELGHAKSIKDAERVADIEAEIARVTRATRLVETATATPAVETAAVPKRKGST